VVSGAELRCKAPSATTHKDLQDQCPTFVKNVYIYIYEIKNSTPLSDVMMTNKKNLIDHTQNQLVPYIGLTNATQE